MAGKAPNSYCLTANGLSVRIDVFKLDSSMIRLALHSPDPRLKGLLSSALKSDFQVLPDLDDHALRHLDGSRVDVLLLDFDSNSSPLEQQFALYDELCDSPVPIVVMSDDLRKSTAVEFLRRGAFDFIRKPLSLIELKVIIGRAHEHALMKAELEQMRRPGASKSGYDQLVGSSGRATVVYDLIRRVADLGASVLITGESGTGKELVARAIHNTGSRANQPFVAVSCGAIPETLIESELFGHERGAFTGSTGARAGYLEQAAGGTLLLDEIGELSPSIQVKLLRVLQQKEFSRLGSNRLIPLTARVLFATHRDLKEMVNAGEFRKDLFYRVKVMDIHVPPLRERTEDIPMLARHFLQRYAAEYGKDVNDIRPNAMESLIDYEWPGNIRELENVIQGAVIRADGSSLCRADLPDHMQPLGEGPVERETGESSNFEELLRDYKVELVCRALVDCNGNKTLAAQKLGLSRAYLHRLIRLRSNPEPFVMSATA